MQPTPEQIQAVKERIAAELVRLANEGVNIPQSVVSRASQTLSK